MLAVATGIDPKKAVLLIESNTYEDYYKSLGTDPERLQNAISEAWDAIWHEARKGKKPRTPME